MLCRLTVFLLFAPLSLGVLFFAPNGACADVIRYVDDSGQTNYVSDPDKVPDKYKGQLSNQKPLPEITKLPAREFDQQLKSAQDADLPRPEVAPRGAPSRSGKVEVFVTDWCPYCRKLEAFLKQNKVSYTRYNIDSSKKGAQLHKQLGGGGVPVTKIGSQVFHGFDQAGISSALKLN